MRAASSMCRLLLYKDAEQFFVSLNLLPVEPSNEKRRILVS